MKTVLLKSKVGATGFTHRPSPYEKMRFDFNFENDFRCQVPSSIWERLKSEYFDRSARLTYKEAFREL